MKSKRQDEILAIITQQEVETQEQLLECLKERGITTTQATISPGYQAASSGEGANLWRGL